MQWRGGSRDNSGWNIHGSRNAAKKLRKKDWKRKSISAQLSFFKKDDLKPFYLFILQSNQWRTFNSRTPWQLIYRNHLSLGSFITFSGEKCQHNRFEIYIKRQKKALKRVCLLCQQKPLLMKQLLFASKKQHVLQSCYYRLFVRLFLTYTGKTPPFCIGIVSYSAAVMSIKYPVNPCQYVSAAADSRAICLKSSPAAFSLPGYCPRHNALRCEDAGLSPRLGVFC